MTTKNTQPGQGAKETPAKEPAKDPAAKEGASNTKSSAKPAAKGKRQVLKVSSRGDSFRRAGLAFSRKERRLYVDELSDGQVDALKAEPRLIVVEGEEEVEETTGTKE